MTVLFVLNETMYIVHSHLFFRDLYGHLQLCWLKAKQTICMKLLKDKATMQSDVWECRFCCCWCAQWRKAIISSVFVCVLICINIIQARIRRKWREQELHVQYIIQTCFIYALYLALCRHVKTLQVSSGILFPRFHYIALPSYQHQQRSLPCFIDLSTATRALALGGSCQWAILQAAMLMRRRIARRDGCCCWLPSKQQEAMGVVQILAGAVRC